jgi:hypothetical protein
VHEVLNLDSTSFSPTALPSSSPTALPSSAPALLVGSVALDRLFGDAVWGRLPVAAGDAQTGAGAEAEGGQIGGKGEREVETRLRRTALGVVGACVSAIYLFPPPTLGASSTGAHALTGRSRSQTNVNFRLRQ